MQLVTDSRYLPGTLIFKTECLRKDSSFHHVNICRITLLSYFEHIKMIKTEAELSTLIKRTLYPDNQVIMLDTEIADKKVCVIEIKQNEGLELWELFRSMVKETGMWPILCYRGSFNSYHSPGNEGKCWKDFVEKEYGGIQASFAAENKEDIQTESPENILSTIIKQHNDVYSENLKDDFPYSLKETLEKYGVAPSENEIITLIEFGDINSYIDLERWLLNWEIKKSGASDALDSKSDLYLQWLEPADGEQDLVLLPTNNSWEVLAYLFWSEGQYSDLAAILVLRYWNEKYGAELVAHYGTMLQFNVARLPENIEESFQLAVQQEAFAPCTTSLPCISLRDHARTLLKTKRWFLHERP